MKKIFLPSCKVKGKYKSASQKLQRYLEIKEKVTTVGCCKVFCSKVCPEDTAVVICNNCAAIMEESSAVQKIEFVWQIIDNDPEFPFPDYHGEKMTIQDCWRAYEKRSVQNAIRSLLHKMNITVIELEENYENTKFCGADLLEPCTDIEKKFAPRRYVVNGADKYNPIPKEKEDLWLQNYCQQIETEKVVCYCMACLDGIQRGGKTAVHLLELIFPE
ncbi:hypothetical protein [Clostridium sp. MD294]|uniref:hypothetical protein n=1 Tax=Clostridium sp. MD294 TaxID=97138 RepID=UPI0002CC0D5D|nr:hypothetical protein [Clostridium sp. MD294]NDO45272.1 hypothetical protein [Clostridium sp. MD294]USF31093.1 hypothetical protein C820_002539 [Clostridium sp. MD294]